MKKYLLPFILLICFSAAVQAQRGGASVGGNFLIPLGDWAELSNNGYGGSITYEHPAFKDVNAVVYVGYTYFDGVNENFSWSMVPIMAGLKAYVLSSEDFYIEGLLGINSITAKTPLLNSSTTDFIGNADFGYELSTGKTGAVDVSAGYVFVSENSYFGFRLAYLFKF